MCVVYSNGSLLLPKKKDGMARTRLCLSLHKFLSSLYPWEEKALHKIRNGRRYTFKSIC